MLVPPRREWRSFVGAAAARARSKLGQANDHGICIELLSKQLPSLESLLLRRLELPRSAVIAAGLGSPNTARETSERTLILAAVLTQMFHQALKQLAKRSAATGVVTSDVRVLIVATIRST